MDVINTEYRHEKNEAKMEKIDMENTVSRLTPLSEKAVNQGVNPADSVNTLQKANDFNNTRKNNIWLTSKQAVNLLGISKVAFHKNRKNNKYTTKTSSGNGGTQYLILLSSLPLSAQKKYLKQKSSINPQSVLDNFNNEQQGEGSNSTAVQSFDPDKEAEIFNSAADYNKMLAEKRMNLIKLSEHINSRKEMDRWVSDYNRIISEKGKLENWSEKQIKSLKTASESVYRYRREYKRRGMAGIIGKLGSLKGRSIVSDELIELYASYALRGGEPSWSESREKVADFVFKNSDRFDGMNYKNLPSLSALKKKLFAVYSESFIQFMRKGLSWWKRNFQYYIERDYQNLKANQVWVGDHFQVDTGSYDSEGNMIFVWVTAWLDMRTLKMLSWDIHIGASNSDHIFITFKRAVMKYGLPECVYIDNGKDYRTNDFAGGRKSLRHTFSDEEKKYTNTLLGMLKVEVIFAEPYNSQAKIIERMFGIIHREFSRFITGYRGINTANRPEQLLKDMKAGNLMVFQEFRTVLDEYMEYGYNGRVQNGKILEGKSPSQKWLELNPAITYISEASLALFCSRVVGSSGRPLTIGRNGVKNSKTGDVYWEEWMSARKGDKVYLRVDPDNKETAYVFEAQTDSLIDMALLVKAAPALAKTEQEREWLSVQIKEKKKELKKFKAMQREIENSRQDDKATVQNMIDRRKAEGKTPELPETKVYNMKKTKADDYIQDLEEIQRTGTDDIGIELNAAETSKPKKRKIALFESDL